MRRPLAAREALGFSPLVQASWAHASCIERVPFTAAGARPFIFLAGRPTAKRAADAGVGGVEALLLVKVTIQDDGGFGGLTQENTTPC